MFHLGHDRCWSSWCQCPVGPCILVELEGIVSVQKPEMTMILFERKSLMDISLWWLWYLHELWGSACGVNHLLLSFWWSTCLPNHSLWRIFQLYCCSIFNWDTAQCGTSADVVFKGIHAAPNNSCWSIVDSVSEGAQIMSISNNSLQPPFTTTFLIKLQMNCILKEHELLHSCWL